MKHIIIALVILATTAISQAGDKIGNGGGLWACVDSQGKILKGRLVDLFEAETELGFQIPDNPGMMAQDIAKKKTELIRGQSDFLASKLSSYLNEVMQKIRFVNAVLEKVDDALYRVTPLPSTCSSGQWQYLQFANFTTREQVLIRSDIWTSSVISEQDKGALLVHEAVYRWLRQEYSDTNSVRSREIVGLLFSNLNPAEISRRIESLLGPSQSPGVLDSWACLMKNNHESSAFLGFGKIKQEAEASVAQLCEKGSANPFFCSKPSSCEQAQTNSHAWICTVVSNKHSRTFSGSGRTQVEASYRALKSCIDTTGEGFFCQEQPCANN